MNAVVSGRAGIAILVDGDRLSSLDVREPGARIPRHPAEAWCLLGDARDLRFLEDVAIDRVVELLEEDTSADEALHLALILLDAEHEDDVRKEAAEALEALLTSRASVTARLEGVLYARPMPEEMDRAGAIGIGRRIAAPSVVRLLEGLSACQPAIADVWAAWDAIPVGAFGSSDDRQRALAEMVREGAFRDLARARASGQSVDGPVAAALDRAAVRALDNHGDILARWSRMIAAATPDVLAAEPQPALRTPASNAAEASAALLGELEDRGLVRVDWKGLAKAARSPEPLPRYPCRDAARALFRGKAA